MPSPITVLLADDHPVVRKGLRATIEDETLSVVAEATNGKDALQQITELKPQVAILDIDMPLMNGLSVAREVRAQQLPTHIIFMTFHADEDLMRAALEAGGKGYLLKGSETDEVAAAVHAVCAGRTHIGSTMARLIFEQGALGQNTALTTNLQILTPTEKRILRLIADGQSSKEVGETLSINYRTVENHRSNICRKFNLEGANALARFALQHRTALHERLH